MVSVYYFVKLLVWENIQRFLTVWNVEKCNVIASILFITDAEGRTYLFDLDFNMGNENPYTVDAAFYGNVSHFINHR